MTPRDEMAAWHPEREAERDRRMWAWLAICAAVMTLACTYIGVRALVVLAGWV